MDQLKLLAAHTVLMGGERNPTQVSGLDMAVIRAGSFEWVSKEALELLENAARKLDGEIKMRIWSSVGECH